MIAGDVDKPVRRLVDKLFADFPPATRPASRHLSIVLAPEAPLLRRPGPAPALYLRWPTPPDLSPAYAALDAVAGSWPAQERATVPRLVYDVQVAQDVSAYQTRASSLRLSIVVPPRRHGSGMRALVERRIARLRTSLPRARVER